MDDEDGDIGFNKYHGSIMIVDADANVCAVPRISIASVTSKK